MPRQPAFAKLVRDTNGDLRGLVEQYHAGKLTADELGEEYYDRLKRGHADAYLLGARQAGSDLHADSIRELADSHGRSAADAENAWLDGFLADLESGKYEDDEGNLNLGAINRRSNMYGQKMRATANTAFVDESPDDATFTWVMGAVEHCGDCPRLAALSPYSASELFTSPGAGDTECLTGCKCYLRRNDGVKGFRRP